MSKSSRAKSPWVRLAWLAFFALIGLFVCSLALSVVTYFVGTVSTTMQRWLVMLQTLLIFAVPAIIFFYLYGDRSAFTLRRTGWRVWIIALVLMPLALPAVNFTKWLNEMLSFPDALSALEQWMQQMEEASNQLTAQLLQTENRGEIIMNLVAMALVPAVSEELFFRGALQRTLTQKMNAHAAIWLTAIIFSAAHLQFYGFIPRMLLGAALGYLFWYSGSIWTSILAHFVNNAATILLFEKDLPFIDVESIGTMETWWVGMTSLVLVVAMVWSLSRLASPKKK